MFFHHGFQIGNLQLTHRLIQGPLAGFSCAAFRQSFSAFKKPAYCVTEMISAHDVLQKHTVHSRYLYKSPLEGRLCYQLSGNNPENLSQAAKKLQNIGADLIDINCGCPQPKIRKKGAGSALLEKPETLYRIVQAIKSTITIPLTIKIRVQNSIQDAEVALAIEEAGADGLIVHGRTYRDDYSQACRYEAIAHIKSLLSIPVIANGDIVDQRSLIKAYQETSCDAFMISRAAFGKPWLYQTLLGQTFLETHSHRWIAFKEHMQALKKLEGEFRTLQQGRSILKYYFNDIKNIEKYFFCDTLEDLFEKLEHKIL